jgi:hypothetical protein
MYAKFYILVQIFTHKKSTPKDAFFILLVNNT